MLLNKKIHNEQGVKTINTKQSYWMKQTNLADKSKHKINKIRSNLLILVDIELSIIKKKCPTKVNNKSVKEFEQEHNSGNNTVRLTTETYSTHCLLPKIGVYNSLTMLNLTNDKQKKENLLRFSSDCPMTKIKTHSGFKRMYHDNFNEKLINRKTLMPNKDIKCFKQKLLKDREDNQIEKYEMLQKNTMSSEKTPSFNYVCYEANSAKIQRKTIELKDIENRNEVQKSFMYLRKLVFLIKNPLDTRKIKSNKLLLEKMAILEFNLYIKIKGNQNPQIHLRRTSNRLQNSSQVNTQNMSLGKLEVRSKIKKHTVNFMNPQINKNCIEESKKYFFGADLK